MMDQFLLDQAGWLTAFAMGLSDLAPEASKHLLEHATLFSKEAQLRHKYPNQKA